MKALLLAVLVALAGCHTITLTDEEYAICEKRGDCVLVSKSAIFEAMDNKKKKIEEHADAECRDRTDWTLNGRGWL